MAQLTAASKSSGVLGFLNLFSGGALTRMAVFGLGIMPYITSSIIIQLLATVIPKLEQWRDQGAVGQKKLTQTTRYLTVALALMQSTGLVYLFHKGGGGLFGTNQSVDLILNYSIWRAGFIVMTLTAGTAFVMWLAELITQRGIGQGMSILIFANVVAGIPSGLNTVLQEGGRVKFTVILLVSLALLVLIVFVDQGQRRIPVTFAKRVVGRKMYGGSNTYIPLKVNQAGVIPIIFASSVLYIPVLLSNIIPSAAFRSWVNHNVTPTSVFYILTYFIFILLFTFFYVYVAFDPHQQADIIRKQGGYIPGIRPGPPDRALPGPHPQPDHLAGGPLPRSGGRHPVPAHGGLEHHQLSLLRDDAPHRNWRGPRDDEADRQPAHDAKLRGLPQVSGTRSQARCPRQTGGRQGDTVRAPLPPLRGAPRLDRGHAARPRSSRARPSG